MLTCYRQKTWAPAKLVFSASANGVICQDGYRQTSFPVSGISAVRATIAPVQARSVRVRGTNQGLILAGEYRAGGKAWLLLGKLLVC